MEIDANKLKSILLDRCWSYRELALNAKIGPATPYKVLRKGTATMKTIGKIAKALEVNPMEIIKE